MFKKRSMGLHWHILIVSFMISIGIIMFFGFIENTPPKPGEFSIDIARAMEKNSITPAIIKIILEKINEVSVEELKDLEAFLGKFESYCEEPYKTALGRRRFDTGAYDGDYGYVYCNANEVYLKEDFRVFFLRNYGRLRPQLLKDVVYFSSSVQKEDDRYFNRVSPSTEKTNQLTMPITLEDGEKIGEFYIAPSFKFPLDYDFNVDGTSREKCIFSAGCTKCQEVIDRYPDAGYKIRKVGCEEYKDPATLANNCEDFKDNFGKTYNIECNGGELCQGQCTPYCSSSSMTEDEDTNTNCRLGDCNNYYGCDGVSLEPATCYCPNDERECFGACLPYCVPVEGRNYDMDTSTKCKDNPCGSYGSCDIASECGCSTGNACRGDCLSYCSSEDTSKTVDADTNTNCQSINCNSDKYVPGSCSTSASSCYCPMGSFECDGTCELCIYEDWVDSGGGCGEGVCLNTQILQEQKSTNGCPTKTRCVDRLSSCLPYCSNAPADEINDGVEDTKCLIGDCVSDYEDCNTINSCVCASGKNPCSGACTAAIT